MPEAIPWPEIMDTAFDGHPHLPRQDKDVMFLTWQRRGRIGDFLARTQASLDQFQGKLTVRGRDDAPQKVVLRVLPDRLLLMPDQRLKIRL